MAKGLMDMIIDIWISNHRHSILTFARECRDEIKHDSEEWAHILSLADEYESYCMGKHCLKRCGESRYGIYLQPLPGTEPGPQDLNEIRQNRISAEFY